MKMLETLRQDAEIAHRLRYPGRRPTLLSRARIAFASRGMAVTAIHRLTGAANARSQSGAVNGLTRRAMQAVAMAGRYVSAVVAKCQIAGATVFEAGVYVSDGGHIILGARRVGSGTVIHHGVTIGLHPIDRGRPEIGRCVWIGPGALVYGNVHVGDGVTILPGTVLSKSVPDRVVVQGNPARIIRRDFDNAPLLRSLRTDVAGLVAQGGQGG
jgi:serine acetyltransferase